MGFCAACSFGSLTLASFDNCLESRALSALVGFSSLRVVFGFGVAFWLVFCAALEALDSKGGVRESSSRF